MWSDNRMIQPDVPRSRDKIISDAGGCAAVRVNKMSAGFKRALADFQGKGGGDPICI